MKLVAWDALVDDDFSRTAEFGIVEKDIKDAIALIRWPPESDSFALYPDTGRGRGQGNGVGPIKSAFILHLRERGWVPEHQRFDAHYSFSSDTLPFAVEWETGNISSSHRAINRLALGMLEDRISGGVLVVPSAEMYRYLTDRVGNARELVPYHDLWRLWGKHLQFGYLAIVTVEHDLLSRDVERITKGTDGRALA